MPIMSSTSNYQQRILEALDELMVVSGGLRYAWSKDTRGTVWTANYNVYGNWVVGHDGESLWAGQARYQNPSIQLRWKTNIVSSSWFRGTEPPELNPGQYGNSSSYINSVFYNRVFERWCAVGKMYDKESSFNTGWTVLISDNGKDWRFPDYDIARINNLQSEVDGRGNDRNWLSGRSLVIGNKGLMFYVVNEYISSIGGTKKRVIYSEDGGLTWAVAYHAIPIDSRITYNPENDYFIATQTGQFTATRYCQFKFDQIKDYSFINHVTLGQTFSIPGGYGFRVRNGVTNELGTTIYVGATALYATDARIIRHGAENWTGRNHPLYAWSSKYESNGSLPIGVATLTDVAYVKGVWFVSYGTNYSDLRFITSLDDGVTWQKDTVDGVNIVVNEPPYIDYPSKIHTAQSFPLKIRPPATHIPDDIPDQEDDIYATKFDGTRDWLYRYPRWTGTRNWNKGILSFHFKVNDFKNTFTWLYSETSYDVQIRFDGGNSRDRIIFELRRPGQASCLHFASDPGSIIVGKWYHALASWQSQSNTENIYDPADAEQLDSCLNAYEYDFGYEGIDLPCPEPTGTYTPPDPARYKFYLNDHKQSTTISSTLNPSYPGLINYLGGGNQRISIGSAPSGGASLVRSPYGSNRFTGELSRFYFNQTDTLDIDQEYIRRRFTDKNNKPVYMGERGELPTRDIRDFSIIIPLPDDGLPVIHEPIIYLKDKAHGTSIINSGYGGDLYQMGEAHPIFNIPPDDFYSDFLYMFGSGRYATAIEPGTDWTYRLFNLPSSQSATARLAYSEGLLNDRWAGFIRFNSTNNPIYSDNGGISWKIGTINFDGVDVSSNPGSTLHVQFNRFKNMFVAHGYFRKGIYSFPIAISDDGISWRLPASNGLDDLYFVTNSYKVSLGNKVVVMNDGTLVYMMYLKDDSVTVACYSTDGGENWNIKGTTVGNYGGKGELTYNSVGNFFTVLSNWSSSYYNFAGSSILGGPTTIVMTWKNFLSWFSGSHFIRVKMFTNDLGTTIVIGDLTVPPYDWYIFRSANPGSVSFPIEFDLIHPLASTQSAGINVGLVYADGTWFIPLADSIGTLYTSQDDGLTWEVGSVDGIAITRTIVSGSTNANPGYFFHKDTMPLITKVPPVLPIPYTIGNGFFAGGYDVTSAISFVEKYNFNSNTTGSAVSLTEEKENGAGVANQERVIFASGKNTSGIIGNIDRHIFTTAVFKSTTVLSIERYSFAGVGNEYMGIFNGGKNSANAPISSTEKYVHGGDTIISATALTVERDILSATGTKATGLFAGGFDSPGYTPFTERYIFPFDTIVTATALLTPRGQGAACGSFDVGIFAGGTNVALVSSIDIYTYAGATVTSVTSLLVSKTELAAAGGPTAGIFAGGTNGGLLNTTEQYNYATNTVSSGGTLGVARRALMGASDSHGGL